MNTEEKDKENTEETMAQYVEEDNTPKTATYAPDEQRPDHTVEGTQPGDQALEKGQPHKGYSTDPAQGKWDASLPLADEDMDRPGQGAAEGEDLKESYEKAEQTKQAQSGRE
ncbi:hypothetical protein HNQ92_002360 [Rhabdobacter roseus]|uniref:Uncharacterized protein n=1 Tax=Rhabdobacter roseus TaxID=1655419 RepID=A0A840TR71_9BACT|nr:hypothetical protein [Rhabdobacter roseus]MBB5284217.1 hypothetical protein [Rhabdobacter roseus]